MTKLVRLHFLLIIVALIALGSQCKLEDSSDTYVPQGNIDVSDSQLNDTWVSITNEISRREIVRKTDDYRYELIAYRFSPQNIIMELNNSSDPMRLDEWNNQIISDLIINGGYFDENYSPTGYLVINGEIEGEKKYAPDKSGLLLIEDGRPSVIDTSSSNFPEISSTTSILQSFPLLIKSGGKPGIKEDSNKLARRTVVAQDNNDNFYIILVHQTPLSLFKLMELLLDSDLNLDVALNLDGGQSSALMIDTKNFNETLLPLTALPQVVSVRSR